MDISLIAALSKNRVIGVNGGLPWHLPADMKFFSETTKAHFIITGRKNYESIPAKYRPLPNRTNIVVTRQDDYGDESIIVTSSIDAAIAVAREAGESEVFVIGGGEIYNQSLHFATKLYLTWVDTEIVGDTYFPEFDEQLWHKKLLFTQSQDAVHNYAFKTYVYSKQ